MSHAAELAAAAGRGHPTLTPQYGSCGSAEPACEIALQEADVAKRPRGEAAVRHQQMTSLSAGEGDPLSSASSPKGNRGGRSSRSVAVAPEDSDSSEQRTPLLPVHRSSTDNSETQAALNSSGYWKSKCYCSIQILNIIGLAIVLFGGLTVSVWLFIERAGNVNSCDESCTLHLVTHQDWNADPLLQYAPKRVTPAELVVIAHTATSPCNSTATCKSELRSMQQSSIKQNFTGIKYSFLVGGDGLSYEARGWNAKAAIAPSIDSEALVIAFIGNFEFTAPPQKQLNQAKAMIDEALYQHKLTPNYKLVAHRQVAHTVSPGEKLFNIIRTWNHWSSCVNEFC